MPLYWRDLFLTSKGTKGLFVKDVSANRNDIHKMDISLKQSEKALLFVYLKYVYPVLFCIVSHRKQKQPELVFLTGWEMESSNQEPSESGINFLFPYSTRTTGQRSGSCSF